MKDIKTLIKEDNLHAFYISTAWLKLRAEVLAEDKYECQMCKARGYYTRANHVHHVNYVKIHPELALSKHYNDDDGNIKRNLISLCHNCHEEIHGHRQKEKPEPLTKERW